MKVDTGIATDVQCPSCGRKGRPVKPITIESLVAEQARIRAGRTDGFRFCSAPSCDVVYYHPETGQRLHRRDVIVRVGQKATAAPRTVCYCFDHTVEEIEAEVNKAGASQIPDSISEKCRRGLDRCEETNPQGACCLGNVRQAMLDAQHRSGRAVTSTAGKTVECHEGCCEGRAANPVSPALRSNATGLSQMGALVTAIAASACCWGPLVLIGLGFSGGAVAATLAPWRPVLLPVTFLLLGVAFYLTYRGPRSSDAARGAPGASEDACCAAADGATQIAGSGRRITRKALNKAMLWVVAALVLAFSFFPNYAGRWLRGSDNLVVRNDLDEIVVAIEGMHCEACTIGIERALQNVPGVVTAEVSYERRRALVRIQKGAETPREEILSAIGRAGSYEAELLEQD